MNSDFRQYLCAFLKTASREIADEWLVRLEPIVQEELRDIFPTDLYLDHIPVMIEEIGQLLAQPDEKVHLVNSTITRKALELGGLRHEQQATVNQLLREYDLLADTLEDFTFKATNTYTQPLTIDDAVSLNRALNRIVRHILQCTVDSFTEKYSATLKTQTDKLVSFNRFLSHELRSPLQSALLNTEIVLESQALTGPHVEDLLMVKSSIQVASSLISSVEELIESSDPVNIDTPTTQSVDLQGLVTDIEEQLSKPLRAQNIRLECDKSSGSLTVETGKLRLILTNLITNSIKYSDPNKSSRQINVFSEARDDGSTIVSVWDNGIGIPSDQLDNVQSLRVRAHAELDTTHDVSGDGIGLYLVSEAVKELHGTLDIDSQEGVYTRASIVLPGADS